MQQPPTENGTPQDPSAERAGAEPRRRDWQRSGMLGEPAVSRLAMKVAAMARNAKTPSMSRCRMMARTTGGGDRSSRLSRSPVARNLS